MFGVCIVGERPDEKFGEGSILVEEEEEEVSMFYNGERGKDQCFSLFMRN